jgi:hypothetical protein
MVEANPQLAACPNCAQGEEADLQTAIDNPSRKYTQLAEVVARYMSQAHLERGLRAANAESMAERLIRIVGGNDISVLILRHNATVAPTPIVSTADIAAAAKTTLVGFGNNNILSTKGFGIQRKVEVDITHIRRTAEDDLDEAEETLGFESDLEFVAGRCAHGGEQRATPSVPRWPAASGAATPASEALVAMPKKRQQSPDPNSTARSINQLGL